MPGCTFCGSTEIKVISYEEGDSEAVVQCLNCEEIIHVAVDNEEWDNLLQDYMDDQ